MWLDKSHDSAQSNKRDKSQTGYACVLWRGDWMHKISKHIRNWKYQQHWLHGGRSQSNSRGATRQVKKIFICLEGLTTFLFRSSQQFARLRLAPLKGFLCWQGALQGPSTSLVRYFLEPQRYNDTALGARSPGCNQEQLTQTLIVCLLGNALVCVVTKLGRPWAPLAIPPLPHWSTTLVDSREGYYSTHWLGGKLAVAFISLSDANGHAKCRLQQHPVALNARTVPDSKKNCHLKTLASYVSSKKANSTIQASFCQFKI